MLLKRIRLQAAVPLINVFILITRDRYAFTSTHRTRACVYIPVTPSYAQLRPLQGGPTESAADNSHQIIYK